MKTNAFKKADILIPKENLESFAVVACDQFTSDPKYWEDVKKAAGDKPSALNIILPEIYLSSDNSALTEKINDTMQKYLNSGVFELYKDSLIYIERKQSDGKIRHGLIGAVDLEKYDYRKGSKTLIRATEETVPDRLPPRVKIREGACLELPHVMLLINDPENKVLGTLESSKDQMQGIYSFELMQKGGHIDGYALTSSQCDFAVDALDSLATGESPLLFAVGDGNHSLAAAKECYLKNPTPENRYALVEIVNIYDSALVFEPIYRVLFGIDIQSFKKEAEEFFKGKESEAVHTFDVISSGISEKIALPAISTLPVGTIQLFINHLCKKCPAVTVDYIHEAETVNELCKESSAVGFIFTGMQKEQLFEAVINDGALPRKTFSMGMGRDKRYYIEARKIK